MGLPVVGSFVQVRGRKWLIEGERNLGSNLTSLRLACIDDDAQGETTDVVWAAELDARVLGDAGWAELTRSGTDDPSVFAAYLRTLRWGTATAAARDLFQAPFRAGIRLDAYQLLPLRKALLLPRVNLLIADDVGAGKTIEAGLVLREMLLRRRVDYTVVAAPAGMVHQWQDELEEKFGLTFTIIDRERLAELRRERGFGVNAWTAGSSFIVSHALIAEEAYASGLRDALGAFRAKAMLILDEAHHAAPAAGARYAVDSQFTRAIRDLANRFEHRLFLSATPHNGHSNSFSSLLEMLDPQRFTRGVPVHPRELEAMMVRRLKSDLRHFGERFPERKIVPIRITGLPLEAPDLTLPRLLLAYGEKLRASTATLPPNRAGLAKLAFVGLQQRLLSSPAAFAHTLEKHLHALETTGATSSRAARDYTAGAPEPEQEAETEEAGADVLTQEDDAAAEAAARLAGAGSDRRCVEDMLALAREAARHPDARVRWLAQWIRVELAPAGRWNARRLIIFTEWETTRRWLEHRLKEALEDLEPDRRIATFTGATPLARREELKHRFNSDPATEPLRILICTDAAREGINLQARCHDLIHFDLPWNPARLEQRNGRIDRKLQPAPTVFCRYFVYDQRQEDIVLDALVRKTETIREELGSSGQVIAARISERLAREGITDASHQAREVTDESAGALTEIASEEMDDATIRRRAREARELDDLRKALEASRTRVGVDQVELRQVVVTALQRAGADLEPTTSSEVEGTPLYRLDPSLSAFASSGWPEALDTLRARPRSRHERLKDWRAAAPVRALSFTPALTREGADAEGVVQLHLEHRLVRRLLSRFLSQGFQSGLARCCVITGPGAQPRVVLLGRIALYGPAAARLHEEIIPVTALRTEAARGTRALRPFGERGEETTLEQLTQALHDPRRPPAIAGSRVRAWAEKDAADLELELRRRAAARREGVERALAQRGEAEAKALEALLISQRDRIAKEEARPEDLQLSLFSEAETRQRRAERRHWRSKLPILEEQISSEPDRVRQSYRVHADRLEIVGLVYLWPQSN